METTPPVPQPFFCNSSAKIGVFADKETESSTIWWVDGNCPVNIVAWAGKVHGEAERAYSNRTPVSANESKNGDVFRSYP